MATKDVTPEVEGLISLDEQVLPLATQQLVLVEDDNGYYHIDGFESKMATLTYYKEVVDNYVYQDEDRKHIKEIKSAINKQIKAIKNVVKARQDELFANVKYEYEQLEKLFMSLQEKLSVGIDAEDKRIKEQNKKELKALFEDAKFAYPGIKDSELSFDDISVVSWFNKSTSRKKAVTEMNNRLQTINSLLVNPMCMVKDLDLVLDALIDKSWDGLQAQELLNENERKRQEEELNKKLLEIAKEEARIKAQAEAELKRKELQEKKQQGEQLSEVEEKLVDNDPVVIADLKPSKLIKISGEDWERAKILLTTAKISFEEI